MEPCDGLIMQLSKATIKNIQPQTGLIIPDEKLFLLPEKVLQFGTGVLLRGLPDYFIDKANRQGIFNGRIVVVKSTSSGGTDEFAQQDGLFTQCIRGIENGQQGEEAVINSSISKVLSAKEDWGRIMDYAHRPEMQVIISNTTEVGIVMSDDKITDQPPSSFPGKLLAFLWERYKAFNGTEESGMVIVPTELISGNGTLLRSIVLELAAKNKLEQEFVTWLQTANHFCNSLVDRIVPGKLAGDDKIATEKKLGYTDDLMIMSECFRLWAIESGSEQVKDILSFTRADEGAVIAADITKFRELKLRLLNGTHTFSSGLAFLAGFETVKEAMQDQTMSSYIDGLMKQEIAAMMSGDMISYEEACVFAHQVMDRFSNPFLDHKWISITMNYTSKMKMRNVPLLLKHYEKHTAAPELMALGFAGYLLFMKAEAGKDNVYSGNTNGNKYPVQDPQAGQLATYWQQNDINKLVKAVLADQSLWETDLSLLPAFAAAVEEALNKLMNKGVAATLQQAQHQKEMAR